MKKEELRALLYDEVAKCNRCGFCLAVCPVYAVRGREGGTPRGKNALLRGVIEGKIDWTPEIEETLFRCTGCRLCTQTCFPAVETHRGVLAGRECLVDRNQYPRAVGRLAEAIEKHFNISNEPNENRSLWMEGSTGIREGARKKEKARVVYFVGCVAAFYPLAHRIPRTFTRILQNIGVDFMTLGGEEWCCGFPLLQAGMKERMRGLIEHNQEKVRALGAESVVFTCPSCYTTWKEGYDLRVETLHSTQFLERLIQDGTLRFRDGIQKTVTYHDPCDLGRKGGVYGAPRNILKHIPGLTLVELEGSRQLSICCGGGGDLELIDPELSAAIARRKIEEIQRTGVEEVVTSCQQCLRTISMHARKNKVKLRVRDITEVVLEVMVA